MKIRFAFRAISLALLIIIVFLGFVKIFHFKHEDGSFNRDKFYQMEPNTIDVLFLGTSHSYCTYNPTVLYSKYGIASYNLSASAQPMWNSYYYLKEVLKTQSPKLIVLEGYALTFDSEYVLDVHRTKNNYGLKLSPNKIRSLQASVAPSKFADFF